VNENLDTLCSTSKAIAEILTADRSHKELSASLRLAFTAVDVHHVLSFFFQWSIVAAI
jgi:hypothetical protein